MLRKAAPWFGAFTAVLIAVGLVAAQSKPMPPAYPTTGAEWLPLYSPPYPTEWDSFPDGHAVFVMRIWKQPEWTHFKLCGLVAGTGDLLLQIADEGDSVHFDAPQPEPLCVETQVPYGGGGAPIPLDVYLRSDIAAIPAFSAQARTNAVQLASPQILVGYDLAAPAP